LLVLVLVTMVVVVVLVVRRLVDHAARSVTWLRSAHV
jgi:hypothetical protein